MEKYSVSELISGVRARDNIVLKYIYRQYFPQILNFIRKNNGSEDDAKDVFQEAIIALYRNSDELHFENTGSFRGYIYAICKSLWFKHLRYRKVRIDHAQDVIVNSPLFENAENVLDDNIEYTIFLKHFRKLGEDCQKVLRMFLEKVPLKDIARAMGYKGELFAKTRKYRCKKMLIDSIKNDPEYKALKEEGLF